MKALITGSENGIGKACKELFSQKGYEVYEIDIAAANPIDVRDRKTLESFVKSIGNIDVVINCSAIQDVSSLNEVSFENWDQVIDVNLSGYFNVIKIVSPYMKDGCIINMGSVHSSLPRQNKFSYDAAKAGVRILTKEMALELAEKNIRVNCLEIGACNTPMNSCFADEKVYEEAKNKTALKVILEPMDVAKVVFELTQDTFKYMTGSIITYDAGRSLK